MRILYIEPFAGGSHARFGEALGAALSASWTRIELPGRHWKWHMRCSAAYAKLAAQASLEREHDVLLASSYLPLAELVGLQPALALLPRVLYFHENQLAYPVRGAPQERDLHYGLTQMVSALAATECWFNSAYNLASFLEEARQLLARMPDAIPPGWVDAIQERARVVPVPLALSERPVPTDSPAESERRLGPIILWNHRWEHDKDPEAFFEALFVLADRGVPFRVALAGERYAREPSIFAEGRARLGSRIVHDGYCASRADYEHLLERVHIAVSTARHEFFGVSMIEATHHGARPVVPRRLAYPEIFDPADLYEGHQELVARLQTAAEMFVAGRDRLRADRRGQTERFASSRLGPVYQEHFRRLVADRLRP